MDRRISYISTQVGSNPAAKYTTEDLAEMVNLSESYLHKLFKSETGRTPTEFIRDIRLEKASDLLLNTFMPLGEIGLAVGISDRAVFTRAFKNRYGMTPREFRKTRDKKTGYVGNFRE